jgi:DNA-directed RNA polymerase sigma subunit (sigma70/sigma32)
VTKGKWGEAMSFVEVGKRMEISAEYGRRLTHAALEKLRRAADEGTLEPALLW